MVVLTLDVTLLAVNSWHPDRCPAVKKYDRNSVDVHLVCPNSSLLLVGDSRTKILFHALLNKMGGNAEVWKFIT